MSERLNWRAAYDDFIIESTSADGTPFWTGRITRSLGSVWAEYEDPAHDAVADGDIGGVGMLGDVVTAVRKLVSANSDMIRRSERGDYAGNKVLRDAWRNLYNALKVIEERG